jgi:hypothetical protein
LSYNDKIITLISEDDNKLWVDKWNYLLLKEDTLESIKAQKGALEIYFSNYYIGITLSSYYEERGDVNNASAIKNRRHLNK